MYEDYDQMKQVVARVGDNISKNGYSDAFKPLVFAVTGTGRVSQGIMEVLEMLPHDNVDPFDLKKYFEEGRGDPRKIVISQFSSKHLVKHKDGKQFDKNDYYQNSSDYESTFYTYLPYINFLVNGIYWDTKYPRVLTVNELREAVIKGQSRLLGVCDISADYEGSIEFTSKFTSIEEPFGIYDPIKSVHHSKISSCDSNSILFHSVDHLPAEMPKEASLHFGDKLRPFLFSII